MTRRARSSGPTSANHVTQSLSLHHVIVLDGLDTSRLYVDDTTGVLVPVQ